MEERVQMNSLGGWSCLRIQNQMAPEAVFEALRESLLSKVERETEKDQNISLLRRAPVIVIAQSKRENWRH